MFLHLVRESCYVPINEMVTPPTFGHKMTLSIMHNHCHSVRELGLRLVTNSILEVLDAFVILGFMC